MKGLRCTLAMPIHATSCMISQVGYEARICTANKCSVETHDAAAGKGCSRKTGSNMTTAMGRIWGELTMLTCIESWRQMSALIMLYLRTEWSGLDARIKIIIPY